MNELSALWATALDHAAARAFEGSPYLSEAWHFWGLTTEGQLARHLPPDSVRMQSLDFWMTGKAEPLAQAAEALVQTWRAERIRARLDAAGNESQRVTDKEKPPLPAERHALAIAYFKDDSATLTVADCLDLTASALYPYDEAGDSISTDIKREYARVKHREKLVGAISRGTVQVLNPLSKMPHESPCGAALDRALMERGEFQKFALSDLGIAVRRRSQHVDSEKRRRDGFYTLEEAAQAIGEQLDWHDEARKSLLSEMLSAARSGRLAVRSPHTDGVIAEPKERAKVCEYYELVTADDVNVWFEVERRPYRWGALSNGNSMVTAQPATSTSVGGSSLPTIAPNVPVESELKRSALVERFRRQWPTIERDLRDASSNGLSVMARAERHGFWRERDALAWAKERGKVAPSDSPAVTGTWLGPIQKYRLKG